MKKILLSPAFFCCLNFSYAQSGHLDPSFGTRGIVKTDMGCRFNYNNSARQVLIKPDGNIYIILSGVFSGVYISKRLPNGSIDSSYGFDGYSRSVPFNNSYAAFQPDGKIVIVGYDGLGLSGVARINENGKPDATFGNNGIKTTAFNPRSVTIQSDGKIVVAAGDGDGFLVARFNTDGSPDNTFNGSGQVKIDFVSKSPPVYEGQDSTEIHSGTANTIGIQADGKIVVGGTAYSDETGNNFAIARFNINGSLDSTFDNDGRQTTITDPYNIIGYSLAIQKDGKILLAGYKSGEVTAVVRYNINGSLDNSFNGNGKQTVNLGSDPQIANSLAIQSDGKIVVSGYTLNGDYNDFAVARFNIDGSPDNTFDNDGMLTTDITFSDDYAGSVAIQSDDRIVVAGYTYTTNISGFVLTRYNANGSLDNSFDKDGKLKGDYNQGYTRFNTSAIQTDGKIVAAGRTWNGSNDDFAVVRYNSNGSLDSTFSNDGKQITDFGATDEAISVVIQPDGKIIVAGNKDTQYAIARYNTDGSLDNTFSGDGKLITSMGFSDIFKSVALQSDGKIVMVGYTFAGTNNDSIYFAIARFNSDGTPDNTFSDDGKLLTNFDAYPIIPGSVVIQTDGKIVVAGTSISNGQDKFSLVRYNNNGSLDTTFSHDGKQDNVFGPDNYFGESLAVQNDGKIVVAGYSENNSGSSSSFAVARYQANGDLDNTFSDDGFQTTYLGAHFNFGISVAIKNDGRIAVGGTNDNYAIVLYKNDGNRDSTFGDDGIQITNVGVGTSLIQRLVFLDNQLYAVGYGQYPGTLGVVARYLLAEGGPLPVSLMDFKAFPQNKSVVLQWQTASEQNLSGFVIQRSADANTFSPVGYVAATGNSSSKINYSTLDQQPLQGVNFYRLKMVDTDGRFTYSKIVSVNLKDEIFTLQVFPNPAVNILNVRTRGENEKATFQIIDAGGRKLKEVNVSLNGNTSFSIYINTLPKGIYNLQLQTKAKIETRRFIKE